MCTSAYHHRYVARPIPARRVWSGSDRIYRGSTVVRIGIRDTIAERRMEDSRRRLPCGCSGGHRIHQPHGTDLILTRAIAICTHRSVRSSRLILPSRPVRSDTYRRPGRARRGRAAHWRIIAHWHSRVRFVFKYFLRICRCL